MLTEREPDAAHDGHVDRKKKRTRPHTTSQLGLAKEGEVAVCVATPDAKTRTRSEEHKWYGLVVEVARSEGICNTRARPNRRHEGKSEA